MPQPEWGAKRSKLLLGLLALLLTIWALVQFGPPREELYVIRIVPGPKLWPNLAPRC